jgi:CheY-like chemotaxis protein
VSKLKLLVAEDEKLTQIIYRKGIQNDTYKNIYSLIIANDGEQAIDYYEELKPDVVVLDHIMPGKTGQDVLKFIREEKSDTSTVVIVASGVSEKDMIAQCADIGIDGYIFKPISARDIGNQILGFYKKKYPDYSA